MAAKRNPRGSFLKPARYAGNAVIILTCLLLLYSLYHSHGNLLFVALLAMLGFGVVTLNYTQTLEEPRGLRERILRAMGFMLVTIPAIAMANIGFYMLGMLLCAVTGHSACDFAP